jgi:hypothetical protein
MAWSTLKSEMIFPGCFDQAPEQHPHSFCSPDRPGIFLTLDEQQV